MLETILITGGTGLVGEKLVNQLVQQGYEVHVLTRSLRSNTPNVRYYQWNIGKKEIDPSALENVSAIVHLAGASVAKRWTKQYKKLILSSRIDSAQLILNTLNSIDHKVKTLISASGSAYYKPNTGKLLKENSEAGNNFLSQVVQQWESSVQPFSAEGCRVVINRIGMVLSKEGGALEKMLPPFKFGVAPVFGNGNHQISWISLHDLVRMIIFQLENNKTNGIYNAVAPEVVSQKQFNECIASVLNKRIIQPKLPRPVLKLMFGEMQSILTDSLALSAEKIQQEGFEFDDYNLREALVHL